MPVDSHKPDIETQTGFFEGFFALIPDLAIIIADDGRLLRVNPACERVTGVPASHSVNRSITALVHPDDVHAVSAKLSEVFGGATATGFAVRVICRDGTYRWIEWEAAPGPDNRVAFATGRDITERKRAHEELEDKDRQLSTIFSSVSDALFLMSVEGEDLYRCVTVNSRFLQITGLQPSEVIGKYLHETTKEWPVVREYYREAIRKRAPVQWEQKSQFPSGVRHGEINISPIFDESGKCTNIVGAVRDLTERNQALLERARLEDQLRQSQKLESIGRLAGGIAHDFNNFLTIIQGYSELLQHSIDDHDPLRTYADRISEAGQRAARLTSQLLAFSRKQVIRSKLLNLNSIIADTRSLLQSLVGEDIDIVTRTDSNVGQVMADPDQMHQVLMNLAANARDAMPEGGTLTIRTSETVVDKNYMRTHPDATPGPCVVLSVSDTGVGMDDETSKNVFEPFFTTKGPGKGTGLGLATVYGIVHQFSGWIEVDSHPGDGTTFRIFLPRAVREELAIETIPSKSESESSGSETILLVEDEPSVRQLTSSILSSRGYSVLTASSGTEALDRAAEFPGPIDLMITDVVMPGMNGRELADRLKPLRPEMKVLFMSGYTADVIVNRGVIDFAASFIAKPFNHEVLSAKVREILNAVPRPRKRRAGS